MTFFLTFTLCAAVFLISTATTKDPPQLQIHSEQTSESTPVKRQNLQLCLPHASCCCDARKTYLAAAEEEIAKSTCRNIYFIHEENEDDPFDTPSTLCDPPRDTRKDIRNCSKTCSARQNYNLSCTQLQDDYKSIRNECNYLPSEAEYCLFDEGDFCFLKGEMSNTLLVDCYATLSITSSAVVCNSTCRAAVNTYRRNAGCCVDYWRNHRYSYGPTIANLFSACDVDIPISCTNFSPPTDFLNCAHESGAGSVSPVCFLIVVCLLTALLQILMIK